MNKTSWEPILAKYFITILENDNQVIHINKDRQNKTGNRIIRVIQLRIII